MWVDFWFTCNASFNFIFQFLKVSCSRDTLLLKTTYNSSSSRGSVIQEILTSYTIQSAWAGSTLNEQETRSISLGKDEDFILFMFIAFLNKG